MMKPHDVISEINVALELMGPVAVIAIGCAFCTVLAVISGVL